jgi:hypothetical protein
MSLNGKEPTEADILPALWDVTGVPDQLDILIEEMSELTKAIIKARRDKTIISDEMISELVDVQLSLDGLLYEILRRGEKSFGYDPIFKMGVKRIAKLKYMEDVMNTRREQGQTSAKNI